MAQGKGPAITPPAVFYSLDKYSKNALNEFVFDLAVKAIGEDQASDENILTWIQEQIEPVLRYRNDRPLDLLAELAKAHKWLTSQDEFQRQRKTRQSPITEKV